MGPEVDNKSQGLLRGVGRYRQMNSNLRAHTFPRDSEHCLDLTLGPLVALR